MGLKLIHIDKMYPHDYTQKPDPIYVDGYQQHN